MSLHSKKAGFTIVELLIVIVVIAVLAAITIVAYTGIKNRAEADAGLVAATNTIKKAQAYNAEIGSYPIQPSQLTGAASTATYYLTGATFATSTSGSSAPSVLTFISCTASVGVKIGYWNITSVAYLYTGSATSANCTSTTGITT